jgi:hypothetical protein
VNAEGTSGSGLSVVGSGGGVGSGGKGCDSPMKSSSTPPGVYQPQHDDEFAKPLLHAAVTLLVLMTAMASAIWIPNVEFIFGLTGATASVLLAYILPAITFIRSVVPLVWVGEEDFEKHIENNLAPFSALNNPNSPPLLYCANSIPMPHSWPFQVA